MTNSAVALLATINTTKNKCPEEHFVANIKHLTIPTLQAGAGIYSECFVIRFLKVLLVCLGSMAAAVQPNSLGTFRKHFTKPSEQVAAPPSRIGVLGLHFGSYLSQMLMDFASIWLIL